MDVTRDGEGKRLGLLVIVLLALAWAVVLAPAILKPRFESSPIDGVRNFERSMGILANTRRGPNVPGRWVMVPKELPQAPKRRRSRIIQRRRQNFLRLLVAAGATFVLGLIPPLRSLLLAHIAIDVALVLYVAQLRRWRAAELERARKVRPLPIDEPIEREAASQSL